MALSSFVSPRLPVLFRPSAPRSHPTVVGTAELHLMKTILPLSPSPPRFSEIILRGLRHWMKDCRKMSLALAALGGKTCDIPEIELKESDLLVPV